MSREILFIGKRKSDEEWIEGCLLSDEKEPEIRYIGYLSGVEDGVVHDVDGAEVYPDTVCQYTGLTDKNGTKIFEGDIVRYVEIYGEVKFGLNENNWQIDKYNQGFFVTFPKEYSLRNELGFWRNKVVVVGNVYDNPELLEYKEIE